MKLLKGVFVSTLKHSCVLARKFMIKSGKTSNLTCFVLANYNHKLTNESITKMVQYWNNRSEDYINFFFIGYLGDDEINNSEYLLNFDNKFSEETFVEAIKMLESIIPWTYSGNPTLLLCKMILSERVTYAMIDPKSMIEIDLTIALKEELNVSVESLFEKIIHVAKENEFSDVDFDFLKKIYGREAGETFIEMFLESLPINISQLFKKAKAVRLIKSDA